VLKTDEMIGAIIGDIVGSRFEKKNLKSKDFELFTKQSKYTDDTVLTIAIADCILNSKGYEKTVKKIWKNLSICWVRRNF
jgi:ADP-ribosylglycohydrolase